MKIFVFTAVNYRSILHRRVSVMVMVSKLHGRVSMMFFILKATTGEEEGADFSVVE